MVSDKKEMADIVKRLDIILTILLSGRGFNQKQIGKILGISTHKLQDIFGKNYEKLQTKNE